MGYRNILNTFSAVLSVFIRQNGVQWCGRPTTKCNCTGKGRGRTVTLFLIDIITKLASHNSILSVVCIRLIVLGYNSVVNGML